MSFAVGDIVEHTEFGPGKVKEVLGSIVVVDFYGVCIECDINDLESKEPFSPEVTCSTSLSGNNRMAFRKGFEAVNLGVVPPDFSSLVKMSIEGDVVERKTRYNLDRANISGLCKVVFGDYGSGKSHYLHLVMNIALQAGWVVSYLEFDPKAVDPAKPHLVYREIISKLKFPKREDGTASQNFRDFIKEIKKRWMDVRDLPYLKKNPWYRYGLETLKFFPHNDDPDYASACDWLAGQPVQITGPGSMRSLTKQTNINPRLIPNMPKVRETGEIYAYHLVVFNQICQALGYNGLLIILDEAEHVRGYSVRRRERANNFLDLLSRSSHLPTVDSPPILNDHGYEFPKFWNHGPHFGLYVGLTEGNTFEDTSLSLRDACVFLHSESDRILLQPPDRRDYENWCFNLFSGFHEHYPDKTEVISAEPSRKKIARALGDEFERNKGSALAIRAWVKLACLVPSVILVRDSVSVEELVSVIGKAVSELAGMNMPWE